MFNLKWIILSLQAGISYNLGDMPELPEVEIIKRGLSLSARGSEIKSIKILNQKSFLITEEAKKSVVGSTILEISRVGKMLILDLRSGYSLVFHLKMTGQVVYKKQGNDFAGGHPNESILGPLPDRSTRVIIKFSDGGTLFFNDQRKFGWIKMVKTGEHLGLIKNLGPDINSNDVNLSTFKQKMLRKSKSKIKQVLLDQSVFAGLGNIYVDESLFMAGLHPESIIGKVPGNKLDSVFNWANKVLAESIEMGGSSSRNYVNSEGGRGDYLSKARVYGRANKDCKKCNNKITKIKVAGRGTHICLNCQELCK